MPLLPKLEKTDALLLLLLLTFTQKEGFAADHSQYYPPVLNISAGKFVHGSDSDEREVAYQLDEKAYGHNRTRTGGWYDTEFDRAELSIQAYEIMTNLISNADYRVFILETEHPAPNVTQNIWESYGLIHPYEETLRFSWKEDAVPQGREHHPVVLVSWLDARAYARWFSIKTGQNWHLPTENQWEKAARGTDGRYFPWGNAFAPDILNSHDTGPFDTLPVGSFPKGASPFGMMDAAGQVFEWTQDQSSNDRYIVKGGSWDDKGCGVCRPAARHSRPQNLKHILVGFRLVREAN